MTIIDTLLSHGDTILIAVVALILGWDRLRSGTSTLRKEITADYKERNDQLDEQIAELNKKHQETLVELASLRATMIEKDKHIESLTALNQDRNPETLALLHKLTDSNASIMEFMKLMHKTLLESKTELHYQSDLLEKGDKRSTLIDQASAEHEGNPLLAPEK